MKANDSLGMLDMLEGGQTFICTMKTWLGIASVLVWLLSPASADIARNTATFSLPQVSIGLPSRITVVNLTGVALTDVKLGTEICSLEVKKMAPGAEATKTSLTGGNCGLMLSFRESGIKHLLGEGLVLDSRVSYAVRVEIRPGFVMQVHTTPEPLFGQDNSGKSRKEL